MVFVFSPTTLAHTLGLVDWIFSVRYPEWDLFRECLLLPGVCSSHDTVSSHTHTYNLFLSPHSIPIMNSGCHTDVHTHTHFLLHFSHSHSLPPSHTPWNSSQAVLPAAALLGAPSVFSSGLRDLNFLPGEPSPDTHWGRKCAQTEEEPCHSGLYA